LRSSVGVDYAPGGVDPAGSPVGDGVAQGRHGQAGLHPRVDRVADDPVGVGVLNRTEIQLPFAGPVFGDVGQPQPVRPWSGEPAGDQVIVRRRPRLSGLGVRLRFTEDAPPAIGRANPPPGAVGHRLPRLTGLVDQQPMPELRVVPMGVEQSVGAVRLHPVGVSDRSSEPPVVGLAGEFQDPARHRDRHPERGVGGGQLTNERVHHFPGRFA
jgi:hypothetical protein